MISTYTFFIIPILFIISVMALIVIYKGLNTEIDTDSNDCRHQNWGRWKASCLYQRRECKDCGYTQDKEI